MQATQERKKIPGPKGKPIVGVGLQLKADPLKFLQELHQNYGDIVRADLGSRKAIFLFNPAHIKYLLASNNSNYHKGNNFKYLKEVIGDGLVTIEDEEWRRHRQIIQPVFHVNQLVDYLTQMNEITKDFIRKWSTKGLLNDFNEMSALTATIVTKTILGTDIELDVEALSEAVSFLTLHIQKRIQSLIALPHAIPTPENRKFSKNMHYIDSIVDSIIEQHKHSSKTDIDILSRLLVTKDPESDKPLTDSELRDEIRTFFLAGHETTATSLTWIHYLLAKHTDVRTKMISEIHSVVGTDRDPIYEDLQKLVYMEQIINESLRLYPPIYIFSRSPQKEDIIDGYIIPIGSTLIVSQYVTQRDPSLWVEPNQFKPERFEEEKIKNIHKYAFIPFGGGPRTCIGKNFAMFEMKVALTKIYQKHVFNLKTTEEVKPEPHFTLRPAENILFELEEQP